MYREITIECPKCRAQFIVSREYCGGIVDCSECGTAFEVLAPKGEAGKNLTKTDTGQLKYKKVEDSTKTIAMSRNDLGMIPELENVKIR
ncbi:MAG: hypothetical protein KAS17_08040 [Victivallaceae bacterium]|nr:hypothetical protein [Victivallaceae bacterium]